MPDEKMNFKQNAEPLIIEAVVKKAIKYNECPVCQAREISEFVESNPWAEKKAWELFKQMTR